jgi:hypothetical protein
MQFVTKPTVQMKLKGILHTKEEEIKSQSQE